jgi:hypothetical protein
MSTVDRINNRLPRFYKGWEENSLIAILLKSISDELDELDDGTTKLMLSHWVDTANGEQLDRLASLVALKRLPKEDDEQLRDHLKRAVDEYKGGGTVPVILGQLKSMLKDEKDFEFIENPVTEASATFAVKANDTWQLGSNSIENEQATISLTVEEEGEVSNPQVSNEDTGESITFNGKLKKGEELILKENCFMLGDKDVTKKMSSLSVPILRRKQSLWKYTEALLERIGVFDTARFDDHTFAVGVPTVRLIFKWIRRQPATFMVQVKSQTLQKNGLDESSLKNALVSLKAAGVNPIFKVME